MCKLVFIFSFKVNQYVHMSGFVFGLFTAVIFLPYITFNHWYTKARVILTCLAGAVLLVMIIFMLIAFYKLQPHVPDYLSYVNCIPFTKLLCPAKSPWARGYIHNPSLLPQWLSGLTQLLLTLQPPTMEWDDAYYTMNSHHQFQVLFGSYMFWHYLHVVALHLQWLMPGEKKGSRNCLTLFYYCKYYGIS